MLNIVIVEDDISQAKSLEEYIKKLLSNENIKYSITHFDSAQKLINSYHLDINLIFMDINLPDIDGMTAAKVIREKDAFVMIIFVTSLAQYAINGYEVGAFDFILKPISYYNFALKFKRALKNINNKEEKFLLITNKNSKRKIEISRIMYIEVIKHTLLYHLEDENISVSGSLKNAQKELEGFPFVLCNQCYLVNLKYVKKIVDYTVFVGTDKLFISHPKKKEFINSLNLYLNCGGD